MISRRHLRQLVESVLLEGFKDDQRYLIEKYPDHTDDISSLQPKWIMWLISRFGESPTQKEIHPFGDAIVTVRNFALKDSVIGEKYRANEQFRTAIDTSFPPSERKWRSPNDVASMSVDEMELVLGLSERKKQRIEVDAAEDIEGDRIGKVGPWNLWLPTTREKSCKIAQYDPITLQPKTTWCTARTAGSNLFYNYIGRPGQETTLFYIIKDDPKFSIDWLSLGFVNGKPIFSSQVGGLSVDRDNKGLTVSRLKKILGSYHDEIMRTLTEKNRELGGKHPAREKIAAAAGSVKALDYLVKGLSAEEATDIKGTILISRYEIAPEVLVKLAGDSNENVRQLVADNPSTPPEALSQLAGDPIENVRQTIAGRRSTPPEVLARLIGDRDASTYLWVARNPSTPPEALARLAGDPDRNVRTGVAYNPSTPPKVLIQLAGDADASVRFDVAKNPSTPSEALARLAGDRNEYIRQVVAGRRATPPEALARLAGDRDEHVRRWVAGHRATPPEALVQLAGDSNKLIQDTVAGNPSTPPEALARLAGDRDEQTRAIVAHNHSTPPEALARLTGDSNKEVRRHVAANPSTPISSLKKLLKDRSTNVKSIAADKIREREAAGLAESRLRQLVRQML
jgi:hypothetical protein